MRRGSPQSTLGWLAGLTASFVLASLFSIAPAAAESCCTLVFTVQPADNAVNPVPNIDGSAFDGSGPPVTVAAVNSSNIVNPSFPNSTADPAVLLVGGDQPYPPTGDTRRGCSTGTFVDPFFHAAAVSTTEQAYQGGGTVMLTLRIDKAWRKLVEARGNPNYRICGAVPLGTDIQHTWNDSPISAVGDQLVFLFPDCTSTIRVFCMVSVNSNGGAIIETAITKTGGDPRHW